MHGPPGDIGMRWRWQTGARFGFLAVAGAGVAGLLVPGFGAWGPALGAGLAVFAGIGLYRRPRPGAGADAGSADWRRLVDEAIQAVMIESEGRLVYANPAAAEMLGYRAPEELTDLETLLGAEQARSLRQLRGFDDEPAEPAAEGDFMLRRADGESLLVRILVRQLDWQGRPAIHYALLDTTASHTAHQALQLNEQRFRDFAEIAADWFWETDADFNFTYLSGRVADYTGQSAESLMGSNLVELLSRHADSPDTVQRLNDDLAARQAFRGIEFSFTGPRGLPRVVRTSGRPLSSEDGRFQGYRGIGRDATIEHRMVQKVAHQATHDSLTGLVNRLEFEQRLARALSNSKRHGTRHALCYLDLDQFKVVNDTAGHVAGDELLRQVTGLLTGRIRQRDTLARQGGDEFTLLLENCDIDKALEVAQDLVDAITRFRFAWEGRHFEVGVSIGVIEVTADALNTVQLLSQADAACYTAKEKGRRQVYSPGRGGAANGDRHLDILRATRLRDALEDNRFELYCQPIYALQPGEQGQPHFELLLRMRDLEQGLLAPGPFIAAAERYGMMGAVDRWVIAQALACFSEESWQQRAPRISINLSGNSLGDDGLLQYVEQQLRQSRLTPANICFEITETAAVSNLNRATRFIDAMRDIGCRFALDDFGSGLSSFSYLKNLNVDYLKIDGAFVSELIDNPVDRATVAAINQVGHVMGIKTVAEFVESNRLRERLSAMGVDFGQGFGLCRPMPLAKAEQAGPEDRPAWT